MGCCLMFLFWLLLVLGICVFEFVGWKFCWLGVWVRKYWGLMVLVGLSFWRFVCVLRVFGCIVEENERSWGLLKCESLLWGFFWVDVGILVEIVLLG